MTYRLRNIGIAIALAAVAVLLVFYYVAQERGKLQEGAELVPVWTAAKNIPEGTEGSELEAGGFIQRTEIEREMVTPGALLDPQAVAQKIVIDPIYKGEQVSQLRFRSQAERGIRSQLTGNLRAVQVPGDEHQLMSGTLQDGDRVDLVTTIKYKLIDLGPGGSSEEFTASRVVLRDVLVLRAPQPADTTSKISEGGDQGGLYVMLAVTDAQAQKLHFVTNPDGPTWTLQLRAPTDATDSPEGVETTETVLTDGLKAQQIELLAPGSTE